MFLDPDERLIVIDQKIAPISLEGKRLLREIGIKTVLAEGHVSWHNVEPERDTHQYAYTDRYVGETREAGLKMLLGVYSLPPGWPSGAFTMGDRVEYHDTLLYWIDPLNQWGFFQELHFIQRVVERYAAPDVCCYYAMCDTGERLLPPNIMCSREQAVAIVLSRQEVFALYSTDLWTSFHPAASWDMRGNEYSEAVYTAMEQFFPEHTKHRLIWTFFTEGFRQWPLDGRYWVGAEYPQNVVANAKRLGQWGARGMVMAPWNPFKSDKRVIDNEILSAVSEALEILGRAK